MKITKSQLENIIREELAMAKEASSLDAGPEYLTQRAKDADLPSGGDSLRQEADALTTMITRLDGMEAFLLNATRHKSDEELTKKAAEKLSALRGTLMQLRGGALRARPESTSSHRMRSED